VNFPRVPSLLTNQHLSRVLVHPSTLASRHCIGPDMTLPLKKALRIAPSSAFRSFIPAARNWKTGSSVKKTLNFLRHMRLTSWRIWRARDIILYFNDWDSLNDAWHFARFYIIGEDCINGTRKYISQILKTLLDNAAELTAYKVCLGRDNYFVCIRASQLRGGY